MSDQDTSTLRKSGSIIWRVVFPFKAMKNTVGLLKNELDRNKENFSNLKTLSDDAVQLVKEARTKELTNNQSFEDAINNRAEGSLSIAELKAYFLLKKRVTILFLAGLLIVSMIGILSGLAYGLSERIVFGLLISVTISPLLFLYALSSQLRLWQLRNRRLSKEEKGGIRDFMRETNNWVWVTLNPEISISRKDS